MNHVSTLDFVLRLLVGLGCGAVVGLERQWRARMAGVRTNALVATGATLFVLYSDVSGNANTTQVAAYVVSGVGFLGGGVILRDGFNVRGLNTAATLWCSAALGVMSASGCLQFALMGTGTVLAVHVVGRPLGHLVERGRHGAVDDDDDDGVESYRLILECRSPNELSTRTLIVQSTGGNDVILRGIDTRIFPERGITELMVHLMVAGEAAQKLEHLISRLALEPGIGAVRWEGHGYAESARSMGSDDADLRIYEPRHRITGDGPSQNGTAFQV